MRNFYKFTFIVIFSVCAKAQLPTFTINSSTTLFCTGRPFSLSANGTVASDTLHWIIKPSRTVTLPADTTSSNVMYTVNNAGTYSVSLIVKGSAGTHTVSKVFNVNRSAKASFNASLSSQGFPSQLTLTNYSSYSNKPYWVFDENFAAKDSTSPLIKTYTASGSYSVLLIAGSSNGCSDTSTYNFRISDSSGITLPNIFSPNNDGINDVFRPTAKGVAMINVWIYNRDGVMISSWDRTNGFWDGYTTSGEPCVAGAYFVVLEATGFDGKKYKLKGNLTLIR